MHGLILVELKKFVRTNFGDVAWTDMLRAAGLESKVYLATDTCPDAEVVALVTAASRQLGKPAPAILESFGEFLVPDLVRLYAAIIHPTWRTLDLLANTETVMHKAVRAQSPGATPPNLICQRPGPGEVVIIYSSPRKMCALARGLVKGIAKHFDERIVLKDQSCMITGDPDCRLSVRLAG